MTAGRLHLVRHGWPRVDRAVDPTRWDLDPGRHDDVRALRARLPTGAAWFTSPEPKARQTAGLLTDGPVQVVDALGEQVRAGWVDDLRRVVDRAFASPDAPAAPGWESLEACSERITAAVAGLRGDHPGEDLVLVGHGTAWTVLAAAIAGRRPDPAALRATRFPDVTVL